MTGSPPSVYNTVYEKLITGSGDDSDLFGYIAYSLYKHEKRLFIRGYEERNGKPPSQDVLDGFINRYETEGGLDKQLKDAEAILIDFAIRFARDPVARSEVEKAMMAEVSGIREDVSKKTSFWKGFWPGVCSSLVVTAGVALLLAGVSVLNPDSNYAKVFQAVVMNKGTIQFVPTENSKPETP